ncbi:MAG: hypothetical protein GX493_10285 [Firmicutes bacterium]|nr:hypothetical protein [Bacillota bacterium]
MRRSLYLLLLTFGFLVSLAGPALAAPDFAVGPPGSYYLFAEFGTDLCASPGTDLVLGSGFALDEELTLGVQIQPFGERFVLGAFGSYWRQPFALNADLRLSFPGIMGRVDAVYLIADTRFRMGIGLGLLAKAEESRFFITLTGALPIREELGVYLTVESFPNTDLNYYHIGLTYNL